MSVGVSGRLPMPDALADRVAAAEVPAREAFVDDDDAEADVGSAARVSRSSKSRPAIDPCAERREEPRRDAQSVDGAVSDDAGLATVSSGFW